MHSGLSNNVLVYDFVTVPTLTEGVLYDTSDRRTTSQKQKHSWLHAGFGATEEI